MNLLARKQNRIPFKAALLAVLTSLCVICDLTADLAVADEQPQQVAPPVPLKKRYRRSKLTSDETEITADRRRLLLTTGEDRTVDLDFEVNGGTNGIAIGNPQIVATTLVKVGDRRQIVFKPLKTGETTITIRDTDGTLKLIFKVRVTATDLLRTAGEVRNLLRDIEGIDIRIVGPKIVIEGEVLVPADYGRLLAVVQDDSYAKLVINLTTLSSLAMQVLAKRIQDDINAFAPNVKTRVVNGLIFLEGTVDSKDQSDRAYNVANLYLPELKPGNMLERDPAPQRLPPRRPIQNFIVINPPPPKKQEKLVRVTVHFVELSKDYNRLFGFKWQPGFSADPQIAVGTSQAGGVSSGGGGVNFSATISSLIPKLLSAQKAGFARIFKTGTVIVRSGKPAKIEDVMEYPFSVSGPNGQVTSQSAKVGLALAVTPVILGQSEDIELDLNLKQNNVTGIPKGGGAPQTSNHTVETKLYVKSNESAAVAGVNGSDVSTSFNDDPNPGSFESSTGGGGQLFNLMRSKNFAKKKTQFVIFVTPQIIDNASEGTDDLKKNFRVKVK